MRRFRTTLIVLACLIAAAAIASWLLREPARRGVLVARGGPEVVVMDFSRPMVLAPLPDGWHHRKFWTREPADFAFAVKQGVPALRIETRDSASMLFRHTDIDLVRYSVLEWRWFVERPINSDIDERTAAGDDHPARLFIAFAGDDGEARRMEIVWGNRRLGRGDFKFTEGFPHYVANGGADNVGRWHRERVDLLALYRKIWKRTDGARVTDIAIFCDSDETDGQTVAYFADVRLKTR